MAHSIVVKLSPWRSSRGGKKIKYIVLHTTEGTDAGDLAYMTDPAQKANVSYHFLIERDGEIKQLVPVSEKAWHAGKSAWGEDKDVNPVSLGIGFSNKMGEMLTEKQYDAGGWLIAKLMADHKISLDRILSHENISFPRKTDPWWTFQFFKLAGWVISYVAPDLKGTVLHD